MLSLVRFPIESDLPDVGGREKSLPDLAFLLVPKRVGRDVLLFATLVHEASVDDALESGPIGRQRDLPVKDEARLGAAIRTNSTERIADAVFVL